ncbi:MAG: type IV toxin-antitoxin system AbiEi family antitoxin domain-containing protein, partial [Dolichospermum sp.]
HTGCMDIRLLRSVAESQHGVITRHQAREMGITDRVWYRLQSSGVLRPVHKGVAVLVGVMIAKNTP